MKIRTVYKVSPDLIISFHFLVLNTYNTVLINRIHLLTSENIYFYLALSRAQSNSVIERTERYKGQKNWGEVTENLLHMISAGKIYIKNRTKQQHSKKWKLSSIFFFNRERRIKTDCIPLLSLNKAKGYNYLAWKWKLFKLAHKKWSLLCVADCAVRFEHSIIAVNEGMVAKKWHISRQ